MAPYSLPKYFFWRLPFVMFYPKTHFKVHFILLFSFFPFPHLFSFLFSIFFFLCYSLPYTFFMPFLSFALAHDVRESVLIARHRNLRPRLTVMPHSTSIFNCIFRIDFQLDNKTRFAAIFTASRYWTAGASLT